MKTPANEAPYLPLLIGSLGAILLVISGSAAVQAWTPDSANAAGVVFGREEFPPPLLGLTGAPAQFPAVLAEDAARDKVKCPECGVVASTREIGKLGAGFDPGATGGLTRDARIALAGKPAKRYEVTVRMKDGSSRVFMDATPANWRPGERVILIEGANQSKD